MAVCDKRSSRHLALLLAVRAAAGCDPYAGALRHRGRHILSALLLGSTIMAANSLQNATSQFGQPLLDGSRCAERHGFIWQIRRTGHPLPPPSMFKNERLPRGLHVDGCFRQPGSPLLRYLLFQSEYGYSPVVSALLLPCRGAIRITVLIAPHAGRWADTISAPAISTLGW